MSQMVRMPHDKDAKLDYSWDWSQWLQAGETITAFTVTGPTGFTISNANQSNGIVVAWVQTVVSGAVTCHIVTSLNREEDRSIFLMVQDR